MPVSTRRRMSKKRLGCKGPLYAFVQFAVLILLYDAWREHFGFYSKTILTQAARKVLVSPYAVCEVLLCIWDLQWKELEWMSIADTLSWIYWWLVWRVSGQKTFESVLDALIGFCLLNAWTSKPTSTYQYPRGEVFDAV